MRGDSSQPVAGHVTVPINTGHAVAQAQPHSRKLGGSSLNSRFQSGPVQGLLLFRREEMQRHSLVDDDSKREKKKKKKRCVGGFKSSVWSGHKSGVHLYHGFLDVKRRTNARVYLKEPNTPTDFLLLLLKFGRMQICLFSGSSLLLETTLKKKTSVRLNTQRGERTFRFVLINI